MSEENKESYAELVERAKTEFGITNADQISEEQLRAEVEAIEAQPATAESAHADEAAPAPVEDEEEAEPDFSHLTRADLNVAAADLGIEAPEDYPNKASLLEAVEAAYIASQED